MNMERERKKNKLKYIVVLGVVMALLVRHFQLKGRKLREAEEKQGLYSQSRS